MINSEQIQEWVDNPVTGVLWRLCEQELSNAQDVSPADCLFSGDPQKTQERLIAQAVKEDEWVVFQNLLKGIWKEYLGDLENYEKLVEDEDEDSEGSGTE